jgi:hypothetical protein
MVTRRFEFRSSFVHFEFKFCTLIYIFRTKKGNNYEIRQLYIVPREKKLSNTFETNLQVFSFKWNAKHGWSSITSWTVVAQKIVSI